MDTTNFLMLISTIITAGASIVAIAISVVSLRQNTIINEENGRAILTITMVSGVGEQNRNFILLKNYGKSAAILDSINFSPGLQYKEISSHYTEDDEGIKGSDDLFSSFVGHTIAPNQIVKIEVDNGFYNEMKTYEVNVIFHSTSNKKKQYSDKSTIVKHAYVGHISSSHNYNSQEKALEGIAKHLEKLVEIEELK